MAENNDVVTSTPQGKRPTIGLLIPWITMWGEPQWHGVIDAAQAQGVNVFCFPGSCLLDKERDPQANILYELVNPDIFDGLIVHGLGLEAYTGREELLNLFNRFAPLPLVNTEDVVEGIPSIISDDYQGIRAVMIHLIEDHGYRHLGFLDLRQHVEHHAGFQARYQAYVDTLAEYNLPLNPKLVIPAGQAYQNMPPPKIIDDLGLTPGKDIDAMIGCNDETAVWFVRGIQAQGIRVPRDIAVVGYNDNPQCRAITPPLTIAKFPSYEMGQLGAETLLALLAGETVAPKNVAPTSLIIRQSCGCIDPDVAQITTDTAQINGQSPAMGLAAHRDTIVAQMVEALKDETNNPVQKWMERLLDYFTQELQTDTPNGFLAELEDVLQQTRIKGGNLPAWQGVISALRRHTLPYLNNSSTTYTHQLLERARIVIERAAQRQQLWQTIQNEKQAELLDKIRQILVTKFDLEELANALAEELPRLGIKSCYLSLYENPQSYTYPQPAPEWSKLIMAYTEQGRLELPSNRQRFRTAQLVPDTSVLPQDRSFSYVVEPLYFKQQQLGFVLFEMGPRQGADYETLRGQISSAVKGALLVQQEERHIRQLQTVAQVSTAASTVLDTTDLLQRVVDLTKDRFGLYHAHIYLLDETGEKLVLTAGAGNVGRRMVAQNWQISRKQEQSLVARVARSGQGLMVNNVREMPDWLPNPLLPDTTSELAVPLMIGDYVLGVLDIQSDKVNNFTDDDIQVQSILAAQVAVALENTRLFGRLDVANAEIKVLNEKLQEENVRMSAELNVAQQLQEMLLPKPEELQQIEGIDIVGYMKPADEVGGDYYDVLEHNGRVKIGIGDVTGHGLESGVVMLMLQTAIRTLLISGITDPIRFMDILNRTIQKNIQRMNVDKSLSLALVDYAAGPLGQVGEMRLSGQHEQVIVVRKGGHIELADTIDLGFPVGLISDIGELVSEVSINLQPGDGIVLYSDGITEAENEARELYGLERLCQVISQHWLQSAEAIKQAIVDNVQAYIGGQTVYDDITLLIIKQK